ncbi:GP46-like surface antigen, putative [Bodo saltans]|uniref:GP46-like surface antigen, putative n=1 Tax=Bodo saltans TaxID=75058 RepID=A0A0S4JQW5_BODSA|nr:GP46-like surface antigen, putative [Bodo saltans]|eukprot:CUG93910.1 GP46-like surface antigen, putative [Bodo saltans]
MYVSSVFMVIIVSLICEVELLAGTLVGSTKFISERDALMIIFNATGRPFWRHYQWNVTDNVSLHCLWSGVHCTNMSRSVVQIILPNGNLSGSLPDVFDALQLLQYLNVSGNSLAGSLASCVLLREFDISRNMFSGTLSRSFQLAVY